MNFASDSGWTPLMHSCHHGNLSLASIMVTLGADVNGQNVGCWTPLTTAAARGFPDVADLLLQQPSLDLWVS